MLVAGPFKARFHDAVNRRGGWGKGVLAVPQRNFQGPRICLAEGQAGTSMRSSGMDRDNCRNCADLFGLRISPLSRYSAIVFGTAFAP
jgi:hypothetical protein